MTLEERVADVVARELATQEMVLTDPVTLRRLQARRIARAVIPIVLEEAARVAEAQRYSPAQVKTSYADGDCGPDWFNEGCNEAAAAIRALGDDR